MFKICASLIVSVLFASLTAAQEPQALTNDDVVGLIKAGLSPAIVTAKIAS